MFMFIMRIARAMHAIFDWTCIKHMLMTGVMYFKNVIIVRQRIAIQMQLYSSLV